MLHLDLRVFGTVQGVFFRRSAKEIAEALKLVGYVENMPDGSVYIEAEGDETALEKFRLWCKEGPPLARISKIEMHYGPLNGYKTFVCK